MSGRPRMSDLASHAGVSVATVSRVLSGKSGISADTREAVLRAVAELDYVPTRTPQRSGLIGIFVPDLTNPAFALFAEQLGALLLQHGRRCVVAHAGSAGTSEATALDTLRDLEVDGVLSVSGAADTEASTEPHERFLATGAPMVVINGHAPIRCTRFINCSDEEAIRSQVAHLQTLGHERIGLAIGPRRFVPSQRKIAAFLALGFPEDSVARTIFTAEGGQLAARRLIDSGHTAIVCGSDIMALGVIREARSQGLTVPGDLSVIGFDDSSLMAFTDPALTTVRQPVQAMCDAAVSGLLRAIDGEPLDGTELLFHPDLIIRQSTGPQA
ncbi:LacI family transcriptional regulator [Arachnia propionica]|uniref:LacI family transcriptional regulator n=1 Tax=Arachnia propionica TaxID=1750 RepID=A0A3P1T2Y0_9ACTN|nr:LacI family DNA-binding transcriptional regulator [Arachnia propionica]RRD03710.1 LacI family transcriptional regulator [Arachnia propionica]